MIWKFPCSCLLGKVDQICSIFVIFPTVFKKKGWKSSMFFDPIITVQVISIPPEERGKESQLTTVHLQPGRAGRTYRTGAAELITSTPPATRPDPVHLCWIWFPYGNTPQFRSWRQPSSHPPPHQSSHCDDMCSCTTVQRRPLVSRQTLQRKRSLLNVLRGLCPRCSDTGVSDKVLNTHLLSSVASCIKLQ